MGIGIAAAAGLGMPTPVAAQARAVRVPRPKVLLEDVVERTAAEFARGQAHGLEVVAEAGQAPLRGRPGGEFVSGMVTLPFPATHLGLHWLLRTGSPEAVAAAVRTSADGQRWTEWYPLTIEAVAGRAEGREVFAALAPGDGGGFAQYKLAFSDGEATVEGVTLTAINTAGGAPQPAPTSALPTVPLTSRAGITIGVVPREAWGCDEDLVMQKLGKSRDTLWPEMYVPTKKVVVHHTATSNTYADGAAEVVAIWSYHAISLGWGDVGYNLLIDKFGNIYEGRHGRGEGSGREFVSADVTAGHCYYHNYGTVGISAIGNYQTAQPTQALKDALDAVAAFACDRHFIEPHGASDFLRSDNAWHNALNNISGHYESYNTSCPGRTLKAYLPDLRSHAAALLDNSGTALSLSTAIPQWLSTPPKEAIAEDVVEFSWSSPDLYAKYYCCLEGWYKHADSEDVDYMAGYAADPSQGGDELAVVQAWMFPDEKVTSFATPPLRAGHYTLHVRGDNGLYEANHTIRVGPKAGTQGPYLVEIESPAPGANVSGVVTIAVDAKDTENDEHSGPGSLHVFVGADLKVGGTVSKIWRLARYNGATYDVEWDTSGLLDGSQHTVDAHATDSAGNTVKAAPVTVTIGGAPPPPPPDPKYVHVALSGSAVVLNKKFWSANVVVAVHDADHQPVTNATVTGLWSGAKTGGASGTTGVDGTFILSTGNLSGTSVTFTAQGVAGTGLTYLPEQDHDPDSATPGTNITFSRP